CGYSLAVTTDNYTLQASCLYGSAKKQCAASGVINVQFAPFTQHVSAQSNATAQDFIASTPTFTVSGLVKNANNTLVFPNVVINVTGKNTVQIKSNPDGTYTASGLQYFGDYTLAPQPFTSGGTTYSTFSCNVIAVCSNPPTASFQSIDHDYLNAIDFTAIPARTLIVASLNPSTGISISVSPNDNNGQGSSSTQFTRTYNDSTVVSLIAPSTASGNNFQKWQSDGVDFATTQSTNVTMGGNHTMTAVYVTPTRTLTVASSNPSSGVSVTVSPNDNNNSGTGFTQFTRTYNINTTVSLTAPANTGGNNFQKWQRDGVDFATTQATSVT